MEGKEGTGCLGHGGNGGRAQLYRGVRLFRSRGKGTVGNVRAGRNEKRMFEITVLEGG